MKTRLIFLVLLIVCFSCGTNNKPLSDAQKEKIKGEVKEVVNTFFKGCDEVNFDMVTETFLNSPDYVYTYNGVSYGYKELLDAVKALYNPLLNQKVTISDEKYSILDKSTVIYTSNNKWLKNFKDGHTTSIDPDALLFILKKINGKWGIIHAFESCVEKSVPSETSKGLNQAELLKKFVGNWEIPQGKDSTEFFVVTSSQGYKGISMYAKFVTKGKMYLEGTGFWAYDATLNKIDCSFMASSGVVMHEFRVFTSPNKLEKILENENVSNIIEFISPNEIKQTRFINNQEVIRTWKRLK